MPISDIAKFEKNNGFRVRVYPFEGKKIVPLHIPDRRKYAKTVNLFHFNNHYSVIKNLSRLISKQKSKHDGAILFCGRCLETFHQKEYENHSHQRTIFPKPGSKVSFRNYKATKEVPFVVFADSECSVDKNSRHDPTAFSYYIVFTPEIEKKRGFKPILQTFTKKCGTHNVVREFLDRLEEDCKTILEKYFRKSILIDMAAEDTVDFDTATKCSICGKKLVDIKNNPKVHDHCHFTGKYRGTAHKMCNSQTKSRTSSSSSFTIWRGTMLIFS
jgi:hypothetical protein